MNAPALTAAALEVSAPKHGVVLVNVGTPDAPTVPAVRKYLAEFLSDPRVVDLPAPARWALLRFVILPFRPKKSAHAYQQIWTDDGSPLLLNAHAQAESLARELPESEVLVAMRYGSPSIADAVAELKRRGISDVTVVPMYPQYALASTLSATEKWKAESAGLSTTVLPEFFDDPGFIEASADKVRETVKQCNADYVLFSYHGLPVHQHASVCRAGCVRSKDPCATPLQPSSAHCYRGQCHATTAAIVRTLGVTAYSTSFQSRLKGRKWISPYTDEVIVELARKGVKRLAIACPSFVADCLETLEEIGVRARAAFLEAGGESLTLVPAVNDSPRFIRSLADRIRGAR
ncbi:MAG: ferrochelatase [Archangium sp.]